MKSDEINKALDRLDKLDFFNQRAGRELWNDKPTDIQNQDIDDYSKDIKFLKYFINRLQAEIERLEKHELSEALNYINQLETENKRLDKKVEELSEVLSDSIKIKVKEIKSEAIKEFAEKLKSEYDGFDVNHEIIEYQNLLKAIDYVTKEMVGD